MVASSGDGARPALGYHEPRWQALRRSARQTSPAGGSWLLILEGELAFPARRDGDGPLCKERQGGLPGVIKADEMALWGRRELPA